MEKDISKIKILLNTNNRTSESCITTEEQIDLFINNMARHIIESRDIQYGEREKLSNRIYNSNNGYVPKNIEEYGLVIINLKYNNGDKLYMDKYALNTKWILKVANDDDHSSNILKNLWFFVHGNTNYPDILDFTEDIIYKGCDLEASKLILNYITNTYLLSINLLDNNILKKFLSDKNYSLHFQKITTYNNELNNLEFVPNKNNIIKDICSIYNLTYEELGNVIGLSENDISSMVLTNNINKQTEASINMFKKIKDLEKESEKNNLLKQLLKEWLN